jgi:hypothetical protein
VSEPLVLPKHLANFKAEQSRHHEVEKNKIREISTRDFDGVFAVIGLNDGKTFPFEAISDDGSEKVLVIDDEYFRFQE